MSDDSDNVLRPAAFHVERLSANVRTILIRALQEHRQYDFEHAIVLLRDENGNMSIWSTDVDKAELCHMSFELTTVAQKHIDHTADD